MRSQKSDVSKGGRGESFQTGMMETDVEAQLKPRRVQRTTVNKRFRGWTVNLFTLGGRLRGFSLCKKKKNIKGNVLNSIKEQ